jgi:hypothetical protein
MKKLSVLAFLASLCTSCLPVPFDLGVSQSVATAGKMTRDSPSSITASYNQNGSVRNFAFYPQVLATGGGGFDYSVGFVTSQDTLSVDIQAVANGAQFASGGQPIANPDPDAPAYIGWPVKSGTSYLFGIVFDAVNPASSGYALFQATPPSVFTSSGSSLLSLVTALGTVDSVIGASVSASTSPSFDLLHILASGGTGYLEAVCQVQSSLPGVVNASVSRVSASLPFIPAGITRVMYYYDDNAADKRSFASWYDTSKGSWVSWAWWEQPVGTINSKQLSASHRLDALLSTGQLLSTEDGVGRLYDRDGNLMTTFPLGNLVYIAEEYVGGVARCYFSQCLIYDGRLHFNVYWIRTDQLTSLGS